MIQILIVDDEKPICDLIQMSLTRAGYHCTCVYDGLAAADILERNVFDLILLDVMLPNADGFELMEYIRPLGIPVIFLTARGSVDDRVRGLRMGAEDYIVKPFEMKEVLARIHAVLRRTAGGEEEGGAKKLAFDKLVINLDSYELLVDGKRVDKTEIPDKATADALLERLQNASYSVQNVKKRVTKRHPAPPFITSTLQQDASYRLGFQSKRTMKVAQELYEGVDIAGHGTMGLITYMRTDSLRISDEAVTAAKEYIADAYGEQYICPYKRTWKTKSATAAQDAHEAIRPSVPGLTPDEVDKSISGDTAKLYRMIWSRFMASQMADCQQDTVSVTVYAGDYRFKASGYTVTFDGFTVLYEEATDEKEKKETSLPPLEQGQLLKLKELKSEQKFTQPPARYTEATLIKALEENGIGRPSTYAPIITTIIDRGYVEREQKKLKPTLLGRAVDGLMLEQFPHIVDVDFSAEMEKNLDKIESGKADWHKTVDDFYQGFAASLEQAEKNMEGKKVKVPDEPSSEVCDLCGRPMVIKVGKYGKFLACSGFPECRGTKRLVKDTGGVCPKCGKGRMLERKSAKGRIYYGCERYPDCDFMTWDTPVPTKCEKCGSTLFRKGSKLYCAKEGCGFEMPVPKKD